MYFIHLFMVIIIINFLTLLAFWESKIEEIRNFLYIENHLHFNVHESEELLGLLYVNVSICIR